MRREGSSYQTRFTWWADVMREAFGIGAYDKPYYAKAGDWCLYLMPPGKVGGGFGDLCARKTSASFRDIMSVFAAQARNPHWQWWVEQHGGPRHEGGYIGFVRKARPEVPARRPDGLPTSRVFRGIGQAYLNSQILDARRGVQVAFKSSPFGTQSHGYEANNSFLLWAYGRRLLIRSGFRDSYGSEHHRRWMWSTRSVNNITVNGRGQGRRTAAARGAITAFATTPAIDLVVGEAGAAYEEPLDRFTRAILFVKPDLVLVYDRLAARAPSSFEYWLHAVNRMEVRNQNDVRVRNRDVTCAVDFLLPQGLTFSQTDQYDPNPRPRITLREYHLTAATAERRRRVEFLVLYRVGRGDAVRPCRRRLRAIPGGYALSADLTDGALTVLLPADDATELRAEGLTAAPGRIAVRRDRAGEARVVFTQP